MSVVLPDALGMERVTHRGGVGQHTLADLGIAALARAQDVLDAARVQFGEGAGADHAAIGDDADAADGEALAQPVDHRQQRLDVGSVARPGFRTQGPAVAVDHHANHHLLQVGAMILRLAARPQRLAAIAVEM